MSWVLPALGRITSPYGPRVLAGAIGDFHYGTDLGSKRGPVYAARDGVVRTIWRTARGAWVVDIRHPDEGGEQVRTRYVHMYRDEINVSVGQHVRAGQQIGRSGASGTSAAHLHLEVLVNGSYRDPVRWFAARGVSLGASALPVNHPAHPGGGSIPSVPDLTPPDPLGDDMPLSDDDLKKIQAAVHSTPIGRTGKTLAQMIDLIDDLPRDVWYYVDRDRGHSVPRYDALNETYLTVKRLGDTLAALPGAIARAVWGFKRGGDGKVRGADRIDVAQQLADILTKVTGRAPDKIKHPAERTSLTDF